MYEACRPADSQDGFPPYYDQSDGVQQFNIIDGAAPVIRAAPSVMGTASLASQRAEGIFASFFVASTMPQYAGPTGRKYEQ